MIADKGCAERGCACHDSRVDGPGVEMVSKAEADAMYEMGWNSALEMAAFKIKHQFCRAFGEDTLASFAVWLKEMKK